MASSEEYLEFIIGQLGTLDEVSSKKMMGEYILYFRGKIFGGIYDDWILVKITKTSRELMLGAIEELPYDEENIIYQELNVYYDVKKVIEDIENIKYPEFENILKYFYGIS